MRKPQEQCLPANKSNCQTGQAHQTGHCEMLEKAAMMLYQVSDILDQLSFQDFVTTDSAWESKMTDMSTQICCNASDLAEFYGRIYIFNKLEANFV